MEPKNLIELIKVSVDKNKQLDNNNSTKPNNILYYDRYSKNIFDVDENGITIYNRKAKNLKENFLIKIPNESLISIAIDKELKYMLCLLLTSSNKKKDKIEWKKNLLLINTYKNKLFEKIDDNFTYILGMFFIGKILNLKNLDINNNVINMNDFCTVLCDKVIFYSIEKKGNGEEYIKKLSAINMTGNILIINFCFDYKHKILCLIKSDLSISFLILTSRKSYKNLITSKLSYVNTLKLKSSFRGMSRTGGEEQKKNIKDSFDNLDKYTQTHFYLETIYNELYLICLCYEDDSIYLHKLENLNNLDNFIRIEYKNNSHFSALQVIDNLIIAHNYITKIIVVIDIKSKIPIISSFYFDFPYENNMHINGEILEERRVFSKNKLINIYGGILYNVNFNEKVYDEIAEKELKENRENKKVLAEQKSRNMQKKKREMNIYDILMNILHRKGTKNLILNILYKIILNDEAKPFLIIKFFKEIINLENTAKEKVEVISDKKLAKKELSESNLPYEVPKPFNIVKAKKDYIKQMDILRNLFDRFGNVSDDVQNDGKNNDDNKKEENNNKNIDDDLIIRVIFYMIQFAKEINYRKIELKPGFYSIILKYMMLLKQKERLIYFFEHETIPDNPEIGKYLVEISLENNTIYKKIFEDFGFKILERTKSYSLIIDFLMKKGDIARAMNYFHEISHKLSYQEINDILTNNQEIIEKNKELFLKYAF